MPVELLAPTELRCTRCGRLLPDGSYWCSACGKLNASRRVRVVFILLIIAIFAGTGLTKWYVSYLRDLQSDLAQRWFTRGEEAMAKGYPTVAIEDYRNALGYDSASRVYRLRLAEALMKESRVAEARANLLSLWSQDPANGELNLDLARLYAGQNQPPAASRYYRAAIDGVWQDDPLQHRTETRFELVQYLMRLGDRGRATAELIAIQAESPEDPATQLKAGSLLLKLGESRRAQKSFQAVLKEDSRNVDALSGAGQAALALGDYRNAVHLLSTADVLTGAKPGSQESAELDLARQVFAMDPFLRNLRVAERASRVAAAFRLAMDELTQCASQQKGTLGATTTASGSKKPAPVLPTKKNGYTAPIAPIAPPPSTLELLYDSGLQRQSSATADGLRNNPDAMMPTMDFVFQVVRATESLCPPQTTEERALQLIATREAEYQR